MKIKFEAYDSDNIVHELPGIQLPCNQTKAEEADLDHLDEDEYIHVIEIPDDWNAPWNPKKNQYGSEFMRQFANWAHRVSDAALFVSGDDDYFDYYPGNISALVGIGEQLDDPRIKEIVQGVLQYVYDVRYYDLEPETIVPFEEVEAYEERRDKALSEAAKNFREAYWTYRIRNWTYHTRKYRDD